MQFCKLMSKWHITIFDLTILHITDDLRYKKIIFYFLFWSYFIAYSRSFEIYYPSLKYLWTYITSVNIFLFKIYIIYAHWHYFSENICKHDNFFSILRIHHLHTYIISIIRLLFKMFIICAYLHYLSKYVYKNNIYFLI